MSNHKPSYNGLPSFSLGRPMTRIAIRCLLAWILLALLPAYGQQTGSRFTSFAGFKLGSVTLSQVENDIAPATLIEAGDAGEYEASICYRTPFGLVYFLSGEMGGSEHTLIGFRLAESDSSKRCAVWPGRRAAPKMSLGGLRLGVTQTEFSRSFATHIRWGKGVAYVAFESKLKMTPTEIESLPEDVRLATLAGTMQNYYDVLVSITGVFTDGKLSTLEVWKTESL